MDGAIGVLIPVEIVHSNPDRIWRSARVEKVFFFGDQLNNHSDNYH